MSAPYRVRIIEFDEERSAHAIFVKASTSPRYILSELDLDPLPKGIITVSGGAKDFPPDIAERTMQLTESVIVPLAYEHDLLIVDGGTAAGVVKIIGEAFERKRQRELQGAEKGNGSVPLYPKRFLMGFVPAPKITYPGLARSRQTHAPLDSNHLSFVLVMDAKDWGGEVKTLFKFLDYLSVHKHIPIANLVVNGGRITIKEVYHAARQGREIIMLEGSARATEVMMAAREGASPHALRELLQARGIVKDSGELRETLRWLNRIAHYDKITRFPFLTRPPEELKPIILSKLGLPPG
jgi:SLOG in TRPM, prokaryote